MIRVALVEDTRTTVLWIQRLLERGGELQVVATATDMDEAAGLPDAAPDVVLVDRWLPDGDGAALAVDLVEALPEAAVYLYTTEEPPADLPDRVGFLRAEDMHLWRRFLTEPRERSSLLVRHPE